MKAISSEIVWSSSPDVLKYKAFFSVPELIEFPTEVPGQNAYAYFYPPTNPLYNSMEEKPPLLVKSHGMLILPKCFLIFRLVHIKIIFLFNVSDLATT